MDIDFRCTSEYTYIIYYTLDLGGIFTVEEYKIVFVGYVRLPIFPDHCWGW